MLEAIAARLEADGVGTVKTSSNNPASWPIYKGVLPPGNVDGVISLLEGPGLAPIDEMGATVGAVVAVEPSLVVQTRHSDYSQANAKAETIWGKLHKLGDVSLSGTRYLLIVAQQQPFPVGRDDAGRHIIGCNYQVSKERG